MNHLVSFTEGPSARIQACGMFPLGADVAAVRLTMTLERRK